MPNYHDNRRLLPPGPDGNGGLGMERSHFPPAPTLEYLGGYAVDPGAGGLLEYWQMLRRRKWILLVSALGFALAGFLIGLPQVPVYQARAALEIEPVNENFLNEREVVPTESPGGATLDSYVQTQVDILQDEPMVERVVTRLKLDQRPEFNRPASGLKKLLQQVRLVSSDPGSAKLRAVRAAMANLRIRSSPSTRLITISFDSTDPKLAADFVNTLANEFIQQSLETRWDSGRRVSELLNKQADELRARLERSERELQAYAARSGLLLTGEKDSVDEQKLRQLQDELSRAQADRIARQSDYNMTRGSRPEWLPQTSGNQTLQEYETKLTELRRQLADLSTLLTPSNYKVQRVQAQIAELETALNKERAGLVNRINNQYKAALDRELLLAGAYARQARLVSDQATRMIHYGTLKREVDTIRALNASMVQRAQEARIASAVHASNIRLVGEATPPARPYKPNLLLNSAIGLFAGLIFGVALMVFREHSDRSVRAPGDSSLWLNVPELGVIPSARVDSPGVLGGLSLIRGGAVDLKPWKRRNSAMAESFRETLLSLLFSPNGSGPKVIVFTSPGPAEGKTTIVSNLGVGLAEVGQRVLLISGDMRQPRLHQIFNLENNWGLTDLLGGEFSLRNYPVRELAKSTDVPNLWVLPSGPATTQGSRLLSGSAIVELLRRCRTEFDVVLVDAPPALGFADARLLARASDGVVLVLRANQTSRDAAVAVAQRFAMDGVPVLGTILNDWDPRSNGKQYGAYGKYYHRYYGANAG